ncbi:uncharacterized protein LOC116845228 [Odontomachus brunneus]|uniref:uncharacterized protein LOC116845228 n=1 Tax=Odontomachus brunneus TaxID=486640 RepID=UPI0013F1C02D|nr:uncharacterized protein LOC116845228 [Odontomachus brunneus]
MLTTFATDSKYRQVGERTHLVSVDSAVQQDALVPVTSYATLVRVNRRKRDVYTRTCPDFLASKLDSGNVSVQLTNHRRARISGKFIQNMYVLSINSFATNLLLLCFISTLCSGTEKSEWTSYEVNKPMRYQFRSTHSDEIPDEERQHRSNIPSYKSKELYNDYTRPQREKSDIQISQLDQRDKEARWKDEEITRKLNILNKMLSEDSNENDIELKNTIEEKDRIIAESSMSEEAKRVARQVRKHRPGFFWTLARLAFETFNDTRSAIQQISNIIGENFEPDTTTQRPSRINSSLVTKPTTPPEDQNNISSNLANVNVTATVTTATAETRTTTTTMRPYKFTVNGVQNLIMRNLRGLVRLFNIEWQDALNQSEVTVKEFQKNLGNQVGSFLQDNPDAY